MFIYRRRGGGVSTPPPSMVDIHSHILWGLDDGARDLEESLATGGSARPLAGTTDIVATPHASPEYEFQPDAIEERRRRAAAHLESPIQLHLGCDFHLSYTNIEDALRQPAKYTINGRRYLLVEFSDLVIFQTSERDLARCATPAWSRSSRTPNAIRCSGSGSPCSPAGWTRVASCRSRRMSYLGRFGKKAEQFAGELTRRGLVHFVASDAHHPVHRPARLDDAYRHLARQVFRATRTEALRRESSSRARRRTVASSGSRPEPQSWMSRLFGRG